MWETLLKTKCSAYSWKYVPKNADIKTQDLVLLALFIQNKHRLPFRLNLSIRLLICFQFMKHSNTNSPKQDIFVMCVI